MRITVHDDIEGVKSGTTVDVEETRAKWYLANGYASTPSYNDEEHPETGVLAKHDPMLAANADTEANPSLATQLADGLGKPADADPDPIVRPEVPVELTNGNDKHDAEKAEAGKQRVSNRQAGTDPADATELDASLVEQRASVADAAEKREVKAAEAAADAAEGTTTDAATDPAEKAAKATRRKV